jgi:hypothetical protein
MPRDSRETISNADQAKELPLLAQQGRQDIYHPPKSKAPPDKG